MPALRGKRQFCILIRETWNQFYSAMLFSSKGVLYISWTEPFCPTLWAKGKIGMPWRRPQMETFSVLLALGEGNSPVTGDFPSQRPVTRSFDVLFDLGLNKRLSKQSRSWCFETTLRPLWRHCNDYLIINVIRKQWCSTEVRIFRCNIHEKHIIGTRSMHNSNRKKQYCSQSC